MEQNKDIEIEKEEIVAESKQPQIITGQNINRLNPNNIPTINEQIKPKGTAIFG